jgi:DNA-binding response OmpR family regulator
MCDITQFYTHHWVSAPSRILTGPKHNGMVVALPMTTARPSAEKKAAGIMWEVSRERRVLIVEDEVRLRSYLAMSLEDARIKVEQAGSLAEARSLLARLHFDAVVLDVGLPDGDGLTLLERAPADRALIITANPDPGRFETHGVRHHLTKPLDLLEFVREVDGLTRSASPAVSASPLVDLSQSFLRADRTTAS